MTLVLLASGDAGAVVDPSPPAPLTGTTAFVEWTPHFASDGSAVALGGSASPLTVGWESFVLDLQPACHDSPLLRASDQDTPSGIFVSPHPSVSGDGRAVAWATWRGSVGTKSLWDIDFLDRTTGSRTTLGTLVGPTTSPRVAMSADGTRVVAVEAVDAGGGNFLNERVRRFGTPLSGCPGAADCDCTITELEVPNGAALAETQSALSADGALVASGHRLGASLRVRRIGFTAGSCVPASTTDLAIHGIGGSDVTLSADGKVAAWSTTADYETGGSFSDTNVWVWHQAEIGGTCPGAQCVPSPAGGTLVRIFTDPFHPDDDSRPLVSADGRRVFFISAGAYFGENPNEAPALWVVDLEATASWAPQRVSPLEASPLANQVEHATANGNGTAVAYQLFHDTDADGMADARDLRLVLVDDDTAADLPEPPGLTAALQPYEVDGVTCSHVGGGDVLVRYDVRQFRGGPRQLVTTLEALAAGGTAVRLGPFVQQLRDEHVAEVTRTVTLTDGDLDDLTCRAQVLWGAGAQPDSVVAAWK